MERNKKDSKYDLVVIVDAKLTNEVKDTVCQEAVDIATKNGAKITGKKVWFEKQKFAFSIKKCNEGTYFLINFECPTAGIAKMRDTLAINERIVRFAIFKAD